MKGAIGMMYFPFFLPQEKFPQIIAMIGQWYQWYYHQKWDKNGEMKLLKDNNLLVFSKKKQHLGGGFNHFLCSSLLGEDDPIWLVFFKWAETTN